MEVGTPPSKVDRRRFMEGNALDVKNLDIWIFFVENGRPRPSQHARRPSFARLVAGEGARATLGLLRGPP
jgi:hypothetical protein